MKKEYRIRLSEEEREWLKGFGRGRQKIGEHRRAMGLLEADETEGVGPGRGDREIAEKLGKTRRWVEKLREKACKVGVKQAVVSKERSDKGIPRKLDGRVQAQISAIACGPKPEGYARWSLSLMGERLVELKVVDSISREGVRQALKKTSFNRT
jgi:hypothetical protein